MARARPIEINPDVTAESPPEEAGGEGSASLFDASGDARVRVLRRDEKTQKMVTHGYMEPMVSEEAVSAQFGGGHYRAQLWVPDASGVPKVKRQRDFYIPGPYKPPAHINTLEDVGPNAPLRGAAAASVAAAEARAIPSGGDDLMQVLKAGIINTLLELMQSTKEMRGAPAGPDPMLLKLMETQATTQTKMMEFMLTLATRDNGGASKKEILAELAQMKEILSPAGGGVASVNPMEQFNTMLETFTRMRDVADDIAPKHEPSDPILGSIPKLVEVVAEQHQLNKQAREAAVMSTRAVPGPAGGVAQMPVVGTIPPSTEGLAMWQRILRQQSVRLVSSAVANHDPDVIAGTAILFAPPNVKEALGLFFHRDPAAVYADVLVEVPQMADHREWLEEFIACAQERLFPDEYSDEEEEKPEDATDGDSR